VIYNNNTFLVLTNVQAAQAGSYSVVATNEAFYTPGVLSTPATLTVLADTDRDGLPDELETSLGLNVSDPSDAALDLDGDGVSNEQEYTAGTDLLDPESYLKVTIQLDGSSQIQFLAKASKTYTLLYKDSLTDPDWSVLVHRSARAQDEVVTLQDPALAVPRRFYQLVTPAQP
jgi:hypothetical protein